MLDKPARRLVDIPIDYLGFTIPDQFVVGYGLDYGEFYRNLPFIGVLRPEVYERGRNPAASGAAGWSSPPAPWSAPSVAFYLGGVSAAP